MGVQPTMTRIAKYALATIVMVLSVAAPVALAAQQWNPDEVSAAFSSGDYATVLRLVRPLADRGFAPAQANLAALYVLGNGVRQDDAVAASWNRKAADQGYAPAQKSLGMMYGTGSGVPQDYVIAHMWLNLSAPRGNKEAVTVRDMVAAKMTPAQIAEAQKLAREWKPK
jgi:uncharacterized protein